MLSYQNIDEFGTGNPGYGVFNPGHIDTSYGQVFTNLSSAGIPSCGDAQAMPAVVSTALEWDELEWEGKDKSCLQSGTVVVNNSDKPFIFICAGHVPKPPNGGMVHVPMAVSGVLEVSTNGIAPNDAGMSCTTPVGTAHVAQSLGVHLLDCTGDTTLVYVAGPKSL